MIISEKSQAVTAPRAATAARSKSAGPIARKTGEINRKLGASPAKNMAAADQANNNTSSSNNTGANEENRSPRVISNRPRTPNAHSSIRSPYSPLPYSPLPSSSQTPTSVSSLRQSYNSSSHNHQHDSSFLSKISSSAASTSTSVASSMFVSCFTSTPSRESTTREFYFYPHPRFGNETKMFIFVHRLKQQLPCQQTNDPRCLYFFFLKKKTETHQFANDSSIFSDATSSQPPQQHSGLTPRYMQPIKNVRPRSSSINSSSNIANGGGNPNAQSSSGIGGLASKQFREHLINISELEKRIVIGGPGSNPDATTNPVNISQYIDFEVRSKKKIII